MDDHAEIKKLIAEIARLRSRVPPDGALIAVPVNSFSHEPDDFEIEFLDKNLPHDPHIYRRWWSEGPC